MQHFYYHQSDSFLERLVVNVLVNLVNFAALAAGLFLMDVLSWYLRYLVDC